MRTTVVIVGLLLLAVAMLPLIMRMGRALGAYFTSSIEEPVAPVIEEKPAPKKRAKAKAKKDE